MKTLIGLLPLALHGAALLASLTLARLASGLVGFALGLTAYPLVLVLVAGLLGRAFARHVREGRFDRDPGTALYRGRMIYGAAWTSIYYCKPLLHFALVCPPLKALLFRLFGYRGSLEFTIYPDSWIRDLRLLDFGPGTYVSNRATLGTNVVRADGQIQVAAIETGPRVLIGHLAMVGGGTKIEEGSEIGVAAKVGFKVRLGKGVSIGPNALVDSATRLQPGVVIGAGAHIGKACLIKSGVIVPPGMVVPDRATITCNADLEQFAVSRRTNDAVLELRAAS